MPELPEVETIKLDLQKVVLNQKITKINVLLNKAFCNPKKLDVLGKISKIDRIGKYLIIDIENKCTLIIHLRMTGKLVYDTMYTQSDKYCRVILFLESNNTLIFSDVRTFGYIEIVEYQKHKEKLKLLGVDALDNQFTTDYLKQKCASRKIPIKNLLLDQHIIAGIGNIYAMEILFDCKISPLRLANSLSNAELKMLYNSTLKILHDAIQHNGTSISDYRRVDNKTGDFQNFLKVYGKHKCPLCGNELTNIKMSGRGTKYCSKCQL